MAPIAAAFLPHPPLLVPGLAGTAAPELDPLRAACREALVTVTAAADLTILVGTGPVWAVPTLSALGSFHPYGTDLDVTLPALTGLDLPAALTDLQLPALTDNDLPGLPPPAHVAELPLSLAIAAHLLATLDPPPTRLAAVTVPPALGPSAAATIGHALAAAGQRAATRRTLATADQGAAPSPALATPAPGSPAAGTAAPGRQGAATGLTLAAAGRGAASADSGSPSGDRGGQAHGSADQARPAARMGLVVMGDLSACRTDRAPGGFRPEAAAFDASISEAFRSATPHRLLDLDPTRAATVLVSGRVPLQVLAGAFEQVDPTGEAGSGRVLDQTRPALRGRVLYEGAPYGVGYLVAILTAS